jgi:hypothetical protein
VQKYAFHLDPLKNILLLHWEKTTKIFHIGFHQINAPSSCAISQLFSEERHGLCKKLFMKRKEK